MKKNKTKAQLRVIRERNLKLLAKKKKARRGCGCRK